MEATEATELEHLRSTFKSEFPGSKREQGTTNPATWWYVSHDILYPSLRFCLIILTLRKEYTSAEGSHSITTTTALLCSARGSDLSPTPLSLRRVSLSSRAATAFLVLTPSPASSPEQGRPDRQTQWWGSSLSQPTTHPHLLALPHPVWLHQLWAEALWTLHF